jgi:hypothetical protein
MALASVEVPAALVAPVRETVVLLFEATVEALHLALARGEPVDEVHRQRVRLAQLGALLDRLGWPPESAPEPVADYVELTAPREILHDAIYGALIDAGERLADACNRCWRGEVEPESVRREAGEVIALDRLLQLIRG